MCLHGAESEGATAAVHLSVGLLLLLADRLTSLSRRECAPAVVLVANRRGWIFKGLSVAARWLVTLSLLCGWRWVYCKPFCTHLHNYLKINFYLDVF